MSSDESENNVSGRFVRLENGENVGTSENSMEKTEKKRKKGIVYVSNIPKYMTVSILKDFLGEYAKVGRVYLQNNQKDGKQIQCFPRNDFFHSIFLKMMKAQGRKRGEDTPKDGWNLRARKKPNSWQCD